ncbi:replication-relaxation family protein [Bacillus piscicola]|uniref:replication-relaxation family protein n=1 Tax=Bacillus piscicola TaxID=1632684 RepID=UPI001F09D279|nr:replication-relaxation family protein [Bacillus piscicola]
MTKSVASRKRGRGRPRTIDEDQLLKDICRHKTLSAQQIRTLHFQGRENYLYVKMHQLKKKGMVLAKPVVRGGKKAETTYYLSEYGIKDLMGRGIIETSRRWEYNTPDWKRIDDILDDNEIYVQLKGLGADIYEKREWKERHQMRRTDYVAAGIRFLGKEYHVYLINDESHDRTLKRIQREIEAEKKLSRYILFFKGQSSFERFRYERMVNGKLELLMFSYLYLPLRLGFLIDTPPLVPYLEKTFQTTPYLIKEGKDMENDFADYEVTLDKETFYVADLLLNDYMKFGQVLRYQSNGYERHQKRVLLVCWKEKLDEFGKNVDPEKIKLIGITVNDLSFHPFYPTYKKRITERDFRAPEKRLRELRELQENKKITMKDEEGLN